LNLQLISLGYGLDYRGSISRRGKDFLSSPSPDLLWDQPSFLCSR